VKDLTTGKVEITSMNHGFAVDKESLPKNVEQTHVSLFDGSNCGLALKDSPPGFDPSAIADNYGDDYDDFADDGRALADLRRAALIHDVGKVGIPDAILSKPGRLDDAELSQMRAHITIGAELIAPLAKAADLAPVIRHHHERWDGQGYPDGLAGEQIPLEARIVSICDSWDAMVNDRPYRRALTVDSASAELAAGAGSQWDPALVKLFVGLNQPLLATAS
jgi:HD-GYP domain-containing protein (c-di-GMP phosphodiesterase class II)